LHSQPAPPLRDVSTNLEGIAKKLGAHVYIDANGTMMVVGATTEPIEVAPSQLITNMRRLHGVSSGVPADLEYTLRFAELTGVRPMIERYPLEKAADAYARMMSVLTMER
jgi:D-arabinose 1-dehydrogenase-like Zn-dependent alcohol dehydrogenase